MTNSQKHAATRALIFDCDGVLADTERDGHRVAFNAAFVEAELPIHWDETLYGELVTIGGGKERIGHVLTPELLRASRHAHTDEPSVDAHIKNTPGVEGAEDASRDALIRSLHARKSQIFQELVANGKVPPRPGVARRTRLRCTSVDWYWALF